MINAGELRVNGIIPIIPTPFNAEELVDWPALGRLVDFAFAAGACAVCLPAFASEFYKLSERERLRLVVQSKGLVNALDPRRFGCLCRPRQPISS